MPNIHPDDIQMVLDCLTDENPAESIKDCDTDAIAHVHENFSHFGLTISDYWVLDGYLEAKWEAYQESLAG